MNAEENTALTAAMVPDARNQWAVQTKAVFRLSDRKQFCDHVQLSLFRMLKLKHSMFNNNVTINISVAHALMWDITTPPQPTWNGLMEWDLGFELHNSTFKHRHRQQRQLFSNIENLLSTEFGVNGQLCVTRARCEAQEVLMPGRSFTEDILYVIFKIPDDEGYHNKRRCKKAIEICPFSLLQFLLLGDVQTVEI
ncbi:hypothetical protein C0J52_05223 [Blattella germanica]|nr:hypothetical protein C0J52_05223 [Blattella germanica]